MTGGSPNEDGGAIATNNTELADHLRKMRNHYKDDWGRGYGYNSRLDNVWAAVLNVKLKYLKESLETRKVYSHVYDVCLRGFPKPKQRDVYQDYVLVCPDRDGLYNFLANQGIQTMKNEYPFPANLRKGPIASTYEAHSLRIPCTPEHTKEEIWAVIAAINSYGR